MEYKNVFKKVGIAILSITILLISAKLFAFYIPFLIAYVISLLVDPAIKWVNKKTNLSRKVSSILVLGGVFAFLIGFISWGIVTLITESNHLLEALNTYFDKATDLMNELLAKIDMDKLAISDEIKNFIQSTSSDVLNTIVEFIKNLLNNFLSYLKSIPKVLIYSVITILATYFITSDKFYILDRLEHHIPKKILGKISVKLTKITKSLGRLFKSTINYDWN